MIAGTWATSMAGYYVAGMVTSSMGKYSEGKWAVIARQMMVCALGRQKANDGCVHGVGCVNVVHLAGSGLCRDGWKDWVASTRAGYYMGTTSPM